MDGRGCTCSVLVRPRCGEAQHLLALALAAYLRGKAAVVSRQREEIHPRSGHAAILSPWMGSTSRLSHAIHICEENVSLLM